MPRRRRLLAQTSRQTLAAFDYGWPTQEEASRYFNRIPRGGHMWDPVLQDYVVVTEAEPRERRIPGTFTPEPFYPRPAIRAARFDR